jgi:hypothetical protein
LGQLSLSCSSSVGWRRRQASLNSPALRSLSSRRCLSSFLSCSLSRRSVTLLLTSPSTRVGYPIRDTPSGQLGALRRALSASRGDSSKIHRGRSRWLLVRRPASSFPQGPFPGTPAPEYMDPFEVLAQAGRRALRAGSKPRVRGRVARFERVLGRSPRTAAACRRRVLQAPRWRSWSRPLGPYDHHAPLSCSLTANSLTDSGSKIHTLRPVS